MVQQMVQRHQRTHLRKLGLTAETVLGELMAVACADSRTLFDGAGKLLPMREWPEQTALAMEVEVLPDQRVKFKQADKLEALDKLCKHLGLLKIDLRPSATVTNITQVNQIRVDRLTDAELLNLELLLEKVGVGTEALNRAPDVIDQVPA